MLSAGKYFAQTLIPVREGPGLDFAHAGDIEEGSSVTVHEQAGAWARVTFEQKTSRWLMWQDTRGEPVLVAKATLRKKRDQYLTVGSTGAHGPAYGGDGYAAAGGKYGGYSGYGPMGEAYGGDNYGGKSSYGGDGYGSSNSGSGSYGGDGYGLYGGDGYGHRTNQLYNGGGNQDAKRVTLRQKDGSTPDTTYSVPLAENTAAHTGYVVRMAPSSCKMGNTSTVCACTPAWRCTSSQIKVRKLTYSCHFVGQVWSSSSSIRWRLLPPVWPGNDNPLETCYAFT